MKRKQAYVTPIPKIASSQIDHAAAGRMVMSARSLKGLKMGFLADKMGISGSYLSLLESGKRNWNDDLWAKAWTFLSK